MDCQSHPFVSVIVPVFNDQARLRLCLAALETQTYPRIAYTVIVVDNASDQNHNIPGVVEQFSQASYAIECKPGSYAARNKGISLAKGDIIAFTDADCIPTADWLEQGVRQLLQYPNCGLVAGRIDIFFRNPDRPTPVELYESVTAFPQEKLIHCYKGAATANLFTLKSVINQVGMFDADLKSRGDLEWGQRVFGNGYQQIYADNVRVHHPARYSFPQLYQRTIRLIAGEYDLKRKQSQSRLGRTSVFLLSLIGNLIPPVIFVVNAFRNSNIKGLSPKIKISLTMFFVRYVSAWEILKLRFGSASSRL